MIHEYCNMWHVDICYVEDGVWVYSGELYMLESEALKKKDEILAYGTIVNGLDSDDYDNKEELRIVRAKDIISVEVEKCDVVVTIKDQDDEEETVDEIAA